MNFSVEKLPRFHPNIQILNVVVFCAPLLALCPFCQPSSFSFDFKLTAQQYAWDSVL
jgi:hypothetical protein